MKNQRNQQQELLYGAHPIAEALKAKRRKLYIIYTTNPLPKAWRRIEPYLPAKNSFQVQYVSKDILDRMVGTMEHMGIVAWMSPFVYRSNFFNPLQNPRLLLLDGVQDVRNVGGILRSAYCTGFDAVILCDRQGAPLSGAAIKASAGLAEHLQVYRATSLASAMVLVQQAGYQIVLAVVNGGQNVTKVAPDKAFCLVIGNEENGISQQILSSGVKVSLPQKRADVSYNASVAAGILMFNLSFGHLE